ncbi:hypothetical protein GQX73_g9128 [Xylaria multiplex]|uniref:Mitochondrial adapter protein MCP1 transmembrane domain-containing protein n=1 Tax=Xylaria multiplex TaxID=323545 RepID=A0A7C8IMV9_9PEZI|nr:hypothetical protein GQX73_g9128 [Xylaria multiplex]
MSAIVFLRVAPLLAATSSLTFTICEDMFIRPLVTYRPDLRPHANRILPAHGQWIWGGLSIIFSMYPISIATAAANLAARDDMVDIMGFGTRQRIAAGFYAAGLLFSVLHFPFGKRAMHLLWTIRNDKNNDDDIKGDNSALMAAWLRVNAVRGLVADFPGWACYLVALVVGTI